VVNFRAPDGDWWGCLGVYAKAEASHVAFRSCDFKVVAGIGLKVGDDCLSQASIHLHLQTVILHLEGWEGTNKRPVCIFYTVH